MKDNRAIGLRIVICLLLIMGLLCVFLGSLPNKPIANTEEQTETGDEMLVVIEDHVFSGYYIVYDKDTKVMYYQGCGTGACLHPLYNADGTLKLYGGD